MGRATCDRTWLAELTAARAVRALRRSILAVMATALGPHLVGVEPPADLEAGRLQDPCTSFSRWWSPPRPGASPARAITYRHLMVPVASLLVNPGQR